MLVSTAGAKMRASEGPSELKTTVIQIELFPHVSPIIVWCFCHTRSGFGNCERESGHLSFVINVYPAAIKRTLNGVI